MSSPNSWIDPLSVLRDRAFEEAIKAKWIPKAKPRSNRNIVLLRRRDTRDVYTQSKSHVKTQNPEKLDLLTPLSWTCSHPVHTICLWWPSRTSTDCKLCLNYFSCLWMSNCLYTWKDNLFFIALFLFLITYQLTVFMEVSISGFSIIFHWSMCVLDQYQTVLIIEL